MSVTPFLNNYDNKTQYFLHCWLPSDQSSIVCEIDALRSLWLRENCVTDVTVPWNCPVASIVLVAFLLIFLRFMRI